MKKRLIACAMAFLMVSVSSVPINAETVTGGEDWKVEFNGSKMTSSFSSADMDEVVYGIQPGDTAELHVKLQNTSSDTTDWYVSNEVLQSLEDATSIAEGGAYGYRLAYYSEDGTENVLYDSEVVGGDDSTGLNEVTGTLKDYFFLDRLSPNHSGEIVLKVQLEGETQGNAYQDTLAKLQMTFATEVVPVEKVSTPPQPQQKPADPPKTTNIVKTGDQSPVMLMVSGVAFVLGLGLVVTVLVSKRKNEKKKGADVA